MRALRVLLIALGATRMASAQVDAATFDWSGAVPAGATLRVVDVEGDIHVSGSKGGQVVVHGERRHVLSGDRALIFEVVKNGSDVTICAYYQHGHCDLRGAHGGEGFHVDVGGRSPSADFTVELPQGINLAANSGDGSIDVRDAGSNVLVESGDGAIHVAGAAGNVDAQSGDGSITIENATRAVTAHTGDGDVELHLAAAASPGAINLHSGDGSVTVFVTPQFGGQLDASTGDGSIESDLPLALSGRLDRQHIRATLGSGGDVLLTIRTGDGNIRIKRE
jgi:Putative adhesin